MKKLLLVSLLALAVCLSAGCGKKQEQAPAESPAASEAAEATEAPSEKTEGEQKESGSEAAAEKTPVPPSSNKEVVKDDDAPKEIYWLIADENNNLTYHLKGCKLIEGKEAQKIDWSIVKSIGLRQCPECNPPQYEGYVEAD